jgi:hypothetical protein
MDPTTTFCPHVACLARGQTGRGNIGIHSRKNKESMEMLGIRPRQAAPRPPCQDTIVWSCASPLRIIPHSTGFSGGALILSPYT